MGGAQSSTASKRDSGAGAGAADKRARPSAAKNIPAGQQQQDTELDEEQQQQQQLELARLRQRLLRPATLLPRPLQPEHEKDHALVLDLMEFFCFAVKVCAQHQSHGCIFFSLVCPVTKSSTQDWAIQWSSASGAFFARSERVLGTSLPALFLFLYWRGLARVDSGDARGSFPAGIT